MKQSGGGSEISHPPAPQSSGEESGSVSPRRDLKKRGSLQASERISVAKGRKSTYSVPNFLNLAPGQNGEGTTATEKRTSIVIKDKSGDKSGLRSITGGTIDGLLELLQKEEGKYPGFVEALVATHTYFIDSSSL